MSAHPPARQHRGARPGSTAAGVHVPDEEAPVSDLVAIAYPDVATAREVASNVGEAQKAHLIELDDVVIVERRGDGKVKLHQPSLAGVGAAGGAVGGGLIGPLFLAPPVALAPRAAARAAPRAGSGAGGGGRRIKGRRPP